MHEFQPEELHRFLRLLDEQLSQAATVIVIGGAAMALGYGVERATLDIDTYVDIEAIRDALARTRELSGLNIPVEFAAVAQVPWNYEDRLIKLDLGPLNYLDVYVPDAHDPALMKIMRGDSADLAAIEALHGRHPLASELLLSRFKDEMRHVIGTESTLRLNLLACIERLFGEEIAADAERRLQD